jgi:hypothetical protein
VRLLLKKETSVAALFRAWILCAVLLLTKLAPRDALHEAQLGTRLALSYGSPPRSSSTMWSTCVALVLLP